MRPPAKPLVSSSSAGSQVITYKYNGNMTYVIPARQYETALDFALEAYPDLACVDRKCIALSVFVKMGTTLRPVRVAPMAWERVAASLAKYEIVEISVMPSMTSRAAKSENDLSSPTSPKYSRDDAPPPLYVSTQFDEDSKSSSSSSNFLIPPPEGHRRPNSALGWLGLGRHP